MKSIALSILILVLFSCKEKSNLYAKDNLDWLVGNWKRTNNDVNQMTFENWSKTNDSLYFGHSFTMNMKDTSWQEKVMLTRRLNIWTFTVSGPNENPTRFDITSKSDTSFIAENSANEFPKKIEYRKLSANKFIAEIYNVDSLKTPFYFEK
jgi:hypothetical protein